MDLLAPLLVLLVSTLGLAYVIEPFVSWYFQWAWWSYVFAADALNRRLTGRSLVRDRPRTFLVLCATSVVLWALFEAINLRLGNWYYVMDHPSRLARWVGGVLAFATVLPGLFETEELIRNLGWRGRVRVALPWSRATDVVFLTLGVASLALPLLWPDVFFPLVWGLLFFLLEPWNRRHAERSFVRDLESGDAGPLLRALSAGLVCGLLWETWNFWARTRWIYTVPGFEELKLFEMPLLGFLGFPPFALQCAASWAALESLWKRAARAPTRRRALAVAATMLGAPFTAAVFEAADRITVDSLYVPVRSLVSLPPGDRQALAAAGLTSPERLLRALDTAEKRRSWAERTGISEPTIEAHRERVALVMHRGLGQARARQLATLGIETPRDLARWSPKALAQALRRQGVSPRDRFLERRARVWVQASGEGGS
jgi:predicted flap endonuclease-1-like 5' DNA nuclease